MAEACEGLVADLAERWELASVYLVVDGRLRCQAARGYFQVVDGFPLGTGVIGRVVATGVRALLHDVTSDAAFIAAVPGLVAEACAPIRSHGEVVGAVNIESRVPFGGLIGEELAASAHALGASIDRLGGLPESPLPQRLARIALGLTALTDAADIRVRAVAGAIDVSGMTSAALSECGREGRWAVRHAAGPLGAQLSAWSDADHRVIAGWVGAGTSSHLRGGRDVPSKYTFLLGAGVRALAVQPLVAGGRVTGLLITADTTPLEHDPTTAAALELLAAQTAASLGMADVLEELRQRAVQDSLTRLPNAAAFAEALAHAARVTTAPIASSSDRQPATRAACLLIDVDRFKIVNDTYGHLAGDRLLQALAAELSAELRDRDTLYRIGGDEFAALLHDTHPAATAAVADRLVQAARRVRTTVSIGGAPVSADPDTCRHTADQALYRAKAAGRDCSAT